MLLKKILAFFVQTIPECVKFLYQHVFPRLEYKGIFVFNLFSYKAFNVRYWMTRLVEVFPWWFCEDFPFDIVSVLTESLLKSFSSFSNVRCSWMVFTVGFLASPSVDYVLRLAVDIISYGMSKAIKITYNLRCWFSCEWANGTSWSVSLAGFPTWGGSGSSCGFVRLFWV